MTNFVRFRYAVWLESYRWVMAVRKRTRANPKTVNINGTEFAWNDWLRSYREVRAFINSRGRRPENVRVVLPSSPPKQVEVKTREIIPVFHFNQYTVQNGFGGVACGPVSALICASAHRDDVNFNTFHGHVNRSIQLMNTQRTGNLGTTPDNMVQGFNQQFQDLIMVTEPFNEANLAKNIRAGNPMVVNMMTNPDFGYRGVFGHYLVATGYRNGTVGINDPAGFDKGRGSRHWYAFNVLNRAVLNNGNRPLFVVKQK